MNKMFFTNTVIKRNVAFTMCSSQDMQQKVNVRNQTGSGQTKESGREGSFHNGMTSEDREQSQEGYRDNAVWKEARGMK